MALNPTAQDVDVRLQGTQGLHCAASSHTHLSSLCRTKHKCYKYIYKNTAYDYTIIMNNPKYVTCHIRMCRYGCVGGECQYHECYARNKQSIKPPYFQNHWPVQRQFSVVSHTQTRLIAYIFQSIPRLNRVHGQYCPQACKNMYEGTWSLPIRRAAMSNKSLATLHSLIGILDNPSADQGKIQRSHDNVYQDLVMLCTLFCMCLHLYAYMHTEGRGHIQIYIRTFPW